MSNHHRSSPVIRPIVWITFLSATPAMTVQAHDQFLSTTQSPVARQPAAPSQITIRLEPISQTAGSDSAVRRVGETPTAPKTFTTDFALAETPIAQSGAWQHAGRLWSYARSIAHHAVGTQTGSGGYDDSYAYLTGFGPDQTVQATLWIDPAIAGNYREVELLLRWADTPTSARGYECNLAWNGSYAQIVRWNGPYGNFTYITNQTTFSAGIMPPGNGDILTATMSGSTIHVYLNKNDGKGDQLIVTGSDMTYRNGNPGMGFFIQGHIDPAQFGFSSYTASSR